MQYSTTLRNNQLDAIETTIGTSPILEIRSGAKPANCAAADSGTLLCSIELPSDWMAAASGGSKGKSGTWSGTGHEDAGSGTNAGHFRIKDSTGTTCHMQGTISGKDGDGEMQIDNVNIAEGQTVTVNNFIITAGNS
jgi:hypothetical protein